MEQEIILKIVISEDVKTKYIEKGIKKSMKELLADNELISIEVI